MRRVRLYPSIPGVCPFCEEGEAETHEVNGRTVAYAFERGKVLVTFECGGSISLRARERGYQVTDGDCPATGKAADDLTRDHDERVSKAALAYRAAARSSRLVSARHASRFGGRGKKKTVGNAEPCGSGRSPGREDCASQRTLPEIAVAYGVTLRELRRAVYGYA